MMSISLRWIVIFCLIQLPLVSEEWNIVYLASFPRSGNHWVRFLVEEATHITTSSVYRDCDFPHLKNAFPWNGYCTDHGYNGDCRYPLLNDSVLLKTHYPFLKKPIDAEAPVAICLIRHPIDAFWSFYKYRGGNEERIDSASLWEFIEGWRKFYEFWENQPHAVFIRYEDLLEETEYYLKYILELANYSFDEIDIKRAINKYPHQGKLLKHIDRYDIESVQIIKTELSDILIRYNYND